jgi:hypothetical protein
MPTEHFETMLVIKNGQASRESTAFLKVIEELDFPFSIKNWLFNSKVYPRLYISPNALNRYRYLVQLISAYSFETYKHHFLEHVVYESTSSNCHALLNYSNHFAIMDLSRLGA